MKSPLFFTPIWLIEHPCSQLTWGRNTEVILVEADVEVVQLEVADHLVAEGGRASKTTAHFVNQESDWPVVVALFKMAAGHDEADLALLQRGPEQQGQVVATTSRNHPGFEPSLLVKIMLSSKIVKTSIVVLSFMKRF